MLSVTSSSTAHRWWEILRYGIFFTDSKSGISITYRHYELMYFFLFRVKNAKIAMYHKRLEGDDSSISQWEKKKEKNLITGKIAISLFGLIKNIYISTKEEEKKKKLSSFPHPFLIIIVIVSNSTCSSFHAEFCVWGTTSTIKLLLLKYLYT